MINIAEITRQLTANAQAIHALVPTLSQEKEQWKPNPESWSLQQVIEHLYNEERLDFRKHLREMFNNPPQSWGASGREEYIHVSDCRQAVDGFLTERQASLAWLKELESPDWDYETQVPFGSNSEQMPLSAGDVLVSWVEHDFLHIRQINELLHGWNVKKAPPYTVDYAGGW